MSRPVSVSIGAIRVRAASGLDARRLADALPAALARALAGLGPSGETPAPRGDSPADRAARAIAAEVARRAAEAS